MRYTEVIYCFIGRISQLRNQFVKPECLFFVRVYIRVLFPKKIIHSFISCSFLSDFHRKSVWMFAPSMFHTRLPAASLTHWTPHIFVLKQKIMLNHRRFTAKAGVKGRWGVWRLEKPNPSHLNPLNFSCFDTLCERVNTFWGYFLRIYARTYIRSISFIASRATSRVCILLHIVPLFPPIHPSVHRLAV